MDSNKKDLVLEYLVELLDLPDSAYEKAQRRYEDLGDWFSRKESACSDYDPHVFPQGSFRLGTAIKPINDDDEYDLDFACSLREGVTRVTHTTTELRSLIRRDLESYRNARGIKDTLDEKHRCWRLSYADELNFHMDIVPCIPESSSQRQQLFESMQSHGMSSVLASNVSELAVAITDDRPEYKGSGNWLISNPEGYAKWFESKVMPTQRLALTTEAQVDDIPNYKKKVPLQRVIQLLKRHRDKMFAESPDSKPISIIITTIAAQSYSGVESIEATMSEVLQGLTEFSNSGSTTLNNPVNPEENFADRWLMPRYSDLKLQDNFNLWTLQVSRDFNFICNTDNPDLVIESAKHNLALSTSSETLRKTLGITSSISAPYVAQAHKIEQPQAKPWLNRA